MDPVDLFMSVIFTGLALILTVISVLAWRRKKGTRLAFVSMAFSLFLIIGLVNIMADATGYRAMDLSLENIGLNIVILFLLYLAVVKGD